MLGFPFMISVKNRTVAGWYLRAIEGFVSPSHSTDINSLAQEQNWHNTERAASFKARLASMEVSLVGQIWKWFPAVEWISHLHSAHWSIDTVALNNLRTKEIPFISLYIRIFSLPYSIYLSFLVTSLPLLFEFISSLYILNLFYSFHLFFNFDASFSSLFPPDIFFFPLHTARHWQ